VTVVAKNFLADPTNGRAYAITVLRPSVVCLSVVCNVCVVAKRCRGRRLTYRKLSEEIHRKLPIGNRTVTWPMTSH